MLAKLKMAMGVGLLGVMVTLSGLAAAQNAADQGAEEQAKRQVVQPYNNEPVWREVRSGKPDAFTTTQVRGRETNVLINPRGEKWRVFRDGPVTQVGGALIVVIALLIFAFHRRYGTIKLTEKPTGRLIQRFTDWERLTHWTTAISFVLLGATGLIMFFGKHVLLPVLGYTLFSWLARISITVHNFVGPAFFVSVIALFVAFVRKNGWRAHDWLWLKKGGGLRSREHVASDFFNAGEKLWFWGGVTLLGLIVSCTGFVLDFANFDQTRNTMQIANMIHSIGALLFVTGSLGHIYMGTLGMGGAYEAMRTGLVDESWAKEHHEFWYNDVKSGKAAAPIGKAAPAARASA